MVVSASIYRPSVAALVRRRDGAVLICERRDVAGSWQFPQGGIMPGETALAALKRELREETSLCPSHYVVREHRGPYRYLFPNGITKKGAHGQEQTYFLLDLLANESAVNVATDEPEFRSIGWVQPHLFDLNLVPPMKLHVYRAVLHDFFGV